MKSEGVCNYCEKTFSSTAMTKHLLSCVKSKKLVGDKDVFLIRAGAGPYFVYFEVNAQETLETVDNFLRDLWLECCGHLSAFTINGVRYNSYCEDLEPDEKTLKYKLSGLLSPRIVFMHEYDFGTTTELNLKVIEKIKGSIGKIKVIARNNPPDFKCGCGNPAKEICSQCILENKSFLCEKCAKGHKCGEEMLLPFVNSPRTGMCGYTGEE